MKIYTVGIGSRSGELIPDVDENGDVVGYVKDRDGRVVTSRLGEATLVQIADKTGGAYFHASARRFGVEDVVAALANLKRSENEARLVKQYDEKYWLPLVLAGLLLFVDICLSERRRRVVSRGDRGNPDATVAGLSEGVPKGVSKNDLGGNVHANA